MNPVAYHSGVDGHAYSNNIEIPASKWTLKVMGNNKEVSNARDGRKRIPGLIDANGTITLHWDSANPLSLTSGGPNLKQGQVIALKLYLDGNVTAITLSAIIDDVNPSSDIDGTVDYEVTFSLESGTVSGLP